MSCDPRVDRTTNQRRTWKVEQQEHGVQPRARPHHPTESKKAAEDFTTVRYDDHRVLGIRGRQSREVSEDRARIVGVMELKHLAAGEAANEIQRTDAEATLSIVDDVKRIPSPQQRESISCPGAPSIIPARAGDDGLGVRFRRDVARGCGWRRPSPHPEPSDGPNDA